MDQYPRLSEAHIIYPKPDGYAKCHTCDRIYIDDLVLYGSILCPTCNNAIERGIVPPEEK